ncbi:PH domain-containing protein [uncultured Lactobacillus sp.]|uniref:PH domain-containing protein n=1 Tax=uncultured Lactobacillus sp. TaxID=153152 RepID=UPI00258FB887|nr:PH domain-containing protein [uncultured Lactobacillus sp.]
MAKNCENCGSKIGFLDQNLKFKDKKYICGKCIEKYGFSKDENHDMPLNKAINWAFDHPYSDFESLKANNMTFKDVLEQKQKEIAPTNFASPSTNSAVQDAARKINKLEIPKEIKQQLINAEVFDFWFNNKELKTLPDILDYKDGEVIKYAASGMKVEGDTSRTVLILCTNRRVLFLNKNILFGGDSTDIPLNMINSVQLSTHILLANITITNGATSTSLKQITNSAAKILAKTIKDEAYKFQQNLAHPSVEVKREDTPDQIRKYKALADDGIITQEEFEAKKKQLLGL